MKSLNSTNIVAHKNMFQVEPEVLGSLYSLIIWVYGFIIKSCNEFAALIGELKHKGGFNEKIIVFLMQKR